MTFEIYQGDLESLMQFLRSENMLRVYHTLYKKFPEEGCSTRKMKDELKLGVNTVAFIFRNMHKKGLVEREGNIYKHIPVSDEQIMGIMKDNEDPRQAYRKIDILWENTMESFHTIQI
jgi:predicted transcriptional regulator